ncbi:STAS domain-containing protein [Streptosporangium amethystogenes]|uniref:STAS domain-containing protein n=1 Tax=Streptosporangium amethystogenes TaxID=2002 RepID=UPI0014706EE6|nr:STAS domain-containing protein [Streptosporangium amethystogenes]
MGKLTLTRQHLPGVTVVTIGGEFDLATADQVEEFVRRTRRPGDQVVIDLIGTRFMDCSGLNVLLRIRHEVGRDGGVLRLAGLQREPVRVLRLTGMGPVPAGACQP